MCISAETSFIMAALLTGGGVICIRHALKHSDRKYLPLAVMPVFVGIQQFCEGLVWGGFGLDNELMIRFGSFAFLFFAWLIWPFWTGFMTYTLENRAEEKKLLQVFAGAGALYGLILFLPYLIHPDWLETEIVHHSISYNTKLLPDLIFPRPVTFFIYLFLIGIPPLISSHFYLKIFGLMLIAFIPLTYLFFYHAHISVLCFFAAIMTLYLVFIVLGDKCAQSHEIRTSH